jgi:ribonuclease HI
VTDWTPSQNQSEDKRQPHWIIYFDGAWGFVGADVAAIITSPSGVKMRYVARLKFQCTNNITEYEAILIGLRNARAMGIQRLIIKIDSQVMAGHIEKDYKARDLELAKYL